jgi:hypothetical protein
MGAEGRRHVESAVSVGLRVKGKGEGRCAISIRLRAKGKGEGCWCRVAGQGRCVSSGNTAKRKVDQGSTWSAT